MKLYFILKIFSVSKNYRLTIVNKEKNQSKLVFWILELIQIKKSAMRIPLMIEYF